MTDVNRSRRSLACALLALFVSASMVGTAIAADSGASIEGVVNLNTATPEELQLLPGIGEVRAAQIVAIRKERGGFKSVSELTEVKGIGDALMERLRGHVTLSGKTTADAR